MSSKAGKSRAGAKQEMDADMAAFASAVAGDFDLLADLHDREPTADVLTAAREVPIERQLGIMLQSADARAALAGFEAALADMPTPIDAEAVEQLAAGYADVYLRHAYRASPAESVWLTEDGLERQAPMFKLRALYRQHELKVTDWAKRTEDHLVLQLRFAAHLLGKARTSAQLEVVARFLDEHLLLWIRRFAAQLVHAGAPDWYAAVALLTATYLDEIREHLAAITGLARPEPPPEPKVVVAAPSEEDRPYMPGIAPSW